MKKKITPIAMRCNKKQFEAIKPKLEGMEIYSVTCFNEFPYLINYDNGIKLSNIDKYTFKNKIIHAEEIHETWNERIFLEACGIEIKETFGITKETIIKYKMKDEFPEVFKVKLEVGKWYKRPHNKALFFIVGDPEITPFEVYGFDMEGNWMSVEKARTFPDYEIEATEQEVFEALKNEAVRRGYKEGVYFNSVISNDVFKFNEIYFRGDNSIVWSKGCGVIFDNGKWATILKTKTKEEAEKLLNCKIID